MLNVYLSGEIHSDWRQEIIDLCKAENLDINLMHKSLESISLKLVEAN